MVLILDGSSEHAVYALVKIAPFGQKKSIYDCSEQMPKTDIKKTEIAPYLLTYI